MHLEFVPQHRDDHEAATARFPGDAPDPRAPGAPVRFGVAGWVCAALVVAAGLLLFNFRGRAGAVLWHALVQADRIDHPVFVAGVLLTAIGGAMVVVPLVYLHGLRRSTRAVIEQTVRIDLGDDCLTVRTDAKELSLAWQGVVAMAETRRLYVLKTLGDLRLALPKRARPGFAETPIQSADALRDLLRRRVTPIAEKATAVPPRLAA